MCNHLIPQGFMAGPCTSRIHVYVIMVSSSRSTSVLYPSHRCKYLTVLIDSGLVGWLGEGQETRRCRRVTYPESYITKYTTYTKITIHFFLFGPVCQVSAPPCGIRK